MKISEIIEELEMILSQVGDVDMQVNGSCDFRINYSEETAFIKPGDKYTFKSVHIMSEKTLTQRQLVRHIKAYMGDDYIDHMRSVVEGIK